jgi:hypothetical protein
MENQFIICTLQEQLTIFPFQLGPNSINIQLQLKFQLIKFNYAKCTTFPLLLTSRQHSFTLLKKNIHLKCPLHMTITILCQKRQHLINIV